ncbi:MAG: hypothetical protein ACE5FM_03430, partial [Methyloligellaceae bacterium]
MTSLAAYIANLAGGASQSPLATPAGPSGGTGLFAALLESTGAAPVIQGELAATLDPSGLPIATPEGQTLPVTASGDAALRQALTEGLGLAQDGAEIDAVIIERPVTTDNEKLVTTNSESLLPTDTGSFTSAGAPQTGATQTDSLPSTVQPDSEGPATKAVQEIFIRPDQALQTPPQSPQTPQTSPQQTAAPVPGPQTPQPAPETGARQETRRQDSGNAAAIARATGLDNALNRASQTGRENGLETALSRAVQSPSKGEAQQNGLVQADDSASAKRAPASDVAKAQDPLSVKPGPARPEFAPSGPKI